ncbi:tRNA-dihydrouridine(47) synthase [NAD(P)(+)]-like protein, partial [Perkinsus olseni]
MMTSVESSGMPSWAVDAIARHEAPIKREYLLLDRPEVDMAQQSTDVSKPVEEATEEDDQQGTKRKRNHGQNKTSDRKGNMDVINNDRQLCTVVARGGTCAFGDGCKFNHDVKSYWAE